jgi:hypothetical protein
MNGTVLLPFEKNVMASMGAVEEAEGLDRNPTTIIATMEKADE